LFGAAWQAAQAAGVTRLADVTRLDRIGLPVWQAVRPMSRALSVHQGKGATAAAAQLGALLEAVESDAGERFSERASTAAFEQLPPSLRAPSIADFAVDRDRPPAADEPVDWVAGTALGGCSAVLLPFPLVSLDFTAAADPRFDRASNGVATGATREDAILAALHELIERDSVREWQALDIAERIACTLDHETIPFAWFAAIERRVAAAGARLQCYALPSLTGTPVFACEINDPGKAALPYRTANGRGAHPLPEIALFRAVAEACQARATFIAGARDDLYPWRYAEPETAMTVAFGLPLPPGMEGVDFASVQQGATTVAELGAALAARGYGQATVIDLARPAGLHVVRAFVCGLGSITRRRRAPLG
jgi:ribosomal protein S12 methylthiotransferase accessory factor